MPKQIVEKLSPFFSIGIFLMFAFLLFTILRTTFLGDIPEEKYVFFEISFLLLLAVLAEIGIIYLKQPSVILLMFVGILMSEQVLHFNVLRDEKLVEIFAQLGAIFLLFKVGLHSKFNSLISKENITVAILGVIVPFIVGFAYATLTGGNFVYSMFLGAALTATSVGVTVALLKEANLMKEKFAEVIIGAAVIDDILGLLVLSFVLNVPTGYDLGGIAELSLSLFSLGLTTANKALFFPIGKILISVIVFLGGGVYAGRWFVQKVIDTNEMNNRNFLIAIAFLFMYSYLAEAIGLSSIVGAFLAGVLLTQSRHIRDIEDKIYPLETIFTPIFFISLGLLVNLEAIREFIIPIMVISIIAIITKVVGCGLGAFASGIDKLKSAIIGLGMSPRGEVALIVALLGLTKGVLTIEEYTIISAMALVTTILPPFAMNYLLKRVPSDDKS